MMGWVQYIVGFLCLLALGLVAVAEQYFYHGVTEEGEGSSMRVVWIAHAGLSGNVSAPGRNGYVCAFGMYTMNVFYVGLLMIVMRF